MTTRTIEEKESAQARADNSVLANSNIAEGRDFSPEGSTEPNTVAIIAITDEGKAVTKLLTDSMKGRFNLKWRGGQKNENTKKYTFPDRLYFTAPMENLSELSSWLVSKGASITGDRKDIDLQPMFFQAPPPRHVRDARKFAAKSAERGDQIKALEMDRQAEKDDAFRLASEGLLNDEELDERIKEIDDRYSKDRSTLERSSDTFLCTAAEIYQAGEGIDPAKPTSDEIRHALSMNEVGDRSLFVKLHGKDFLFDPEEGNHYRWTGTLWELDQSKRKNKAMDDVAGLYSDEAKALEDSGVSEDDEGKPAALLKSLKKRADQIRASRRQKDVFTMLEVGAHIQDGGIGKDPHKAWDDCKGFIPCSNGLISLQTGQLEPPRRERYIRRNNGIAFDPYATAPHWERFLIDIMSEDTELSEFLRRLFGYIALGYPKEHRFVFLYGSVGRNGKGTLVRILSKAVGRLATSVSSELLLLQRNAPSLGAARPDLIKLEGARFAFCSEINKGRTLDSSILKNLSGGDEVVGRALYDQEKNFLPSHTMIFQANYRPKAPAEDTALWSRAIILPFERTFVERPDPSKNEGMIDIDLERKLEGELPGIVNWLVKGAMEYAAQGLRIPEKVKAAVKAHRDENNGIERFLSERCLRDPIFSIRRNKLTQAIQEFCLSEGIGKPSSWDISAYMRSNGFREEHLRNGDIWRGVSVESDEPL